MGVTPPVRRPTAKDYNIIDYNQRLWRGWGELPTKGPKKDEPIRVMTLTAPPNLNEQLVYRFEIYGRPWTGTLTWELERQWYLDTKGICWDLMVNDHITATIVGVLRVDESLALMAEAINKDPTWKSPELQKILDERRRSFILDDVRTALRDVEPRIPPSPFNLMVATHLHEEDDVRLEARVPPNWQTSQRWRVGCTLQGLQGRELDQPAPPRFMKRFVEAWKRAFKKEKR